MTKQAELATWLLGLVDTDPRIDEIDAVRRGDSAAADDSDRLGVLSVSEAARRARVSRPVIYRALHEGVLTAAPLYRGGRKWIPETALRRWLSGSCEVQNERRQR